MIRVGRDNEEVEIEMERRDLEEIRDILMVYGNILNAQNNSQAKSRVHRLREELDDKIREAQLSDEQQERIERLEEAQGYKGESCDECGVIGGHCPECSEAE